MARIGEQAQGQSSLQLGLMTMFKRQADFNMLSIMNTVRDNKMSIFTQLP